MENRFKESKFIEQMMVIGEGKKHPAALIVPAMADLKNWCNENNIAYTDVKEYSENEAVIEMYKNVLDEFNKDFGNWEQIKKFELISDEWTVASGELTPTLKAKRKVIMAKYDHLIEKIYN